ncbi:DUF2752 domain-containing protein [Seonamhaeicola sp. ML3]|uniref:DUF2752 domain-containing protein n=1 Tax=Seonamhaeicola sp. ML3 TaxID=2937786 RepID=UPI003530C40A
MLPCLNKKLFGFECFGCGLQRSVVLIFRGEFVEAFHMYPAIYTLIILFILIGINFFKLYKISTKLITAIALLNAVIIICSFIVKNFYN